MSDVSETAGELGISYDERSLAEGVLSNSQDELQITQRLCELLLRAQYGAAYLIANQQVAGGVSHPGTFLAQAIGALLYGSAAAAAEGRAALYKITDALSGQQQASFYSLLVKPVVPNLLGKMFYGGDSAGTLQLLDIVTAASPCLRPVFDLSASIEPVNLSAMRVRGAERARLINMLPAPPPHRRRRAVVAIRDLIFPQNPASRPHEARATHSCRPRLLWVELRVLRVSLPGRGGRLSAYCRTLPRRTSRSPVTRRADIRFTLWLGGSRPNDCGASAGVAVVAGCWCLPGCLDLGSVTHQGGGLNPRRCMVAVSLTAGLAGSHHRGKMHLFPAPFRNPERCCSA